MSKNEQIKAEKAAMEMMSSGFRHHTYEEEMSAWLIFQLDREEFEARMSHPEVRSFFMRYRDVLGPDDLRSLKNGFISLVTSLCRVAMRKGVNDEFSQAISDYYIMEMEKCRDEEQLWKLVRQMLLHHYDLIRRVEKQRYSRPIAKAVRFIGRNLYGRCTVVQTAEYVGLERHYFSNLFAKEVGISPGKYIRKLKMTEAKRLLSSTASAVTEAAESLGFCDTAHFSRSFKKEFGITPSEYKKGDLKRED